MVNQERLGCNCALVAAVAYGFISGSVGSGKNFGIASLVVYGVSGIVVIIAECINSNNEKLRKIDRHTQAIKIYSALDLLTAEVLVSVAQVDMKIAALTLIPSLLDLVFYYTNKSWDDLTPWCHIGDIVVFVILAFKYSQLMLVPTAVAYTFEIFGTDGENRDYDRNFVAVCDAVGIFCAAWSIKG